MTVVAAIDIERGVTDAWRTFATFLPRLVGFLLILLIGYLVAKVVAKVLDKVLERVGFDRAVERGGIKKAMSKSKYDASDIVSKLAFYLIFVIALGMAFNALGIDALEAPIAAFIALIPRILVAVVLFVVGAAIAAAVKNLISNMLGGLSYGNAVATGVSVLILVLFGKAALDEVGVAETVTTPLLYSLLAAAVGIAVVGVGGGLIKPMQTRWEQTLGKARLERQRIQDHVSSQSTGQPTTTTRTVAGPGADGSSSQRL